MTDFPPRSTFDKARRKQAVKKIGRALRDEDTQELLPIGEVTKRLRMFEQSYVGIRSIPIDDIVGTVDRSHEFDREFLPRRADMEERWRRVEQAFPASDFPPIEVYEVDGKYFLIDGHHRVAVARQRGVQAIDAEVIRIRTKYPLPKDADIRHIIHTEQERVFMEESGLERSRPDARIEFSRPQGYSELLDNVKVHGFNLMRERDQVLANEEIAGDWYDRVYVPTIRAVERVGLRDIVPNTTDGDLYLKVHQHLLALVPERGRLSVDDVADALRESEIARQRHRRSPIIRMTSRARKDD
jgi:hypothetical protein